MLSLYLLFLFFHSTERKFSELSVFWMGKAGWEQKEKCLLLLLVLSDNQDGEKCYGICCTRDDVSTFSFVAYNLVSEKKLQP